MTTINSDLMSGIDRPQQSVAKTAAEFQTLWQQHAPGRPLPAVDFAKNMVVAVFLGSRPSGGFAVEITGVQQRGRVDRRALGGAQARARTDGVAGASPRRRSSPRCRAVTAPSDSRRWSRSA